MTRRPVDRSAADRRFSERARPVPHVEAVAFDRRRLDSGHRLAVPILLAALGLVVALGLIGHGLDATKAGSATAALPATGAQSTRIGTLTEGQAPSPAGRAGAAATLLAPRPGAQVNSPVLNIRGSTDGGFHRILVVVSLRGVAIGTLVSASAPSGLFVLAVPLDPVNPGPSGLPIELEVFDLTNSGRPMTAVDLRLAAFPASE